MWTHLQRACRPQGSDGIRKRPASVLPATVRWSVHLVLLLVVAVLVCPRVSAAEPVAQAPATQAQATSSAGNNAGATTNASANSTGQAIPSSAAAGGITITQPQQTAAQSYYKIAQGISVTIGWNFTSVLQYPSSLIVQAYCSENSNTYTLASSLPGTATAFTWAPWDYDQRAAQSGQPQLIQATYRLQIYDERGMSVGALPGRFQPNTKVEFALYQPKPYTPISEGWVCAGCNSAVGVCTSKSLAVSLVAGTLAVLLLVPAI